MKKNNWKTVINETIIILPVSRPDFLQKIFASLEMLDIEGWLINILVIVDGNHDLYDKCLNFTMNSKFGVKECIYFKSHGQPDPANIKKRRKRIGEIHQQAKAHILGNSTNLTPPEYVFLIEDDSPVPPNTLTILKRGLRDHRTGASSALQLGRWGLPYIGAWKVNDVYNITEINSFSMDKINDSVATSRDRTLLADAVGFYCMLCRWKVYKDILIEPFDDVLGPDFKFCIELRRIGFLLRVMLDIHIPHLVKNKEPITFLNSDPVQVTFKLEEGKWKSELGLV